MTAITPKPARYGMAIDLDRCTGCGACMIACAVENNVPPARPEATPRTGITWMRVYQISNGASFPDTRAAFIPILCQQCGKDTPCVAVCPQEAVEVDPATGIVDQMPQRCLGCRYCMAACPYHARYFNWWDPQWPAGMEKTLNPDVATRMRGVVEKCNFCHGRLHAARSRAAAEGRRELHPGEYVPACMEACPAAAIVFGDLDDPASEVARLARDGQSFRILEKLGTEPKIYYRTARPWVRQAAAQPRPASNIRLSSAPRTASEPRPLGSGQKDPAHA
jgi:molybdopterin-containing oxidoreductase family iron-sulfur binding subunit